LASRTPSRMSLWSPIASSVSPSGSSAPARAAAGRRSFPLCRRARPTCRPGDATPARALTLFAFCVPAGGRVSRTARETIRGRRVSARWCQPLRCQCTTCCWPGSRRMIVLIILSVLPDLLWSWRIAEGQGPTPARPANLRSRRPPWSTLFPSRIAVLRIEIDGNSGRYIRRTRGWAVCSTTGLPSGSA